ncbi:MULTISPECIES: acetyltransferase [Methylomonas]|uniref:Sugar O-acyltransferase n=1 Tax=Methylomonas koyamae TaxID=702114 RepID=A0A291III6_9GAMM|nr:MULTISPECIES: acetyltransferase [Methylomonas]ANE55263.1 sugar O-acyltransferase [Methylomonas sp. DH-1]ATG90069.1 Sugar O-acyltransferase [Methylomonas koyamae]OAI23134.1 sugar O-acyltransferase [Methylomonas koyamae]
MIKSKKLIIVGDTAFAEIALEYFDADSDYEVVGFSVEEAFLKAPKKCGLPVMPFEHLDSYFSPDNHYVYVAIVYTQLNRLRTRLSTTAKNKGYKLASYISSRAFIWRNVELGEHCFIFEDNTVQPFVKIGKNVVLWSGNHIGHHSTINDNCFIASHAVISGFCDIGENTFIGVNATVANNINVGKDNWLGPNTVIMKNTESGSLFKTEQPDPAKITANRFFKVKE